MLKRYAVEGRSACPLRNDRLLVDILRMSNCKLSAEADPPLAERLQIGNFKMEDKARGIFRVIIRLWC